MFPALHRSQCVALGLRRWRSYRLQVRQLRLDYFYCVAEEFEWHAESHHLARSLDQVFRAERAPSNRGCISLRPHAGLRHRLSSLTHRHEPNQLPPLKPYGLNRFREPPYPTPLYRLPKPIGITRQQCTDRRAYSLPFRFD